MIKRVVNFLFPPELDLVGDEGGFLNFLVPAATWGLGKLFGGGGGKGGMDIMGGLGAALPGLIGSLLSGGSIDETDLPQNLQDTGKMTRDGLQQAQDLRGDQIQIAHDKRRVDIENRNKIGSFDPTNMGGEFGFLGDMVGQFDNLDRSVPALREQLADFANIGNQAMAAGSMAPQTNLGIANLLMGSNAMAGQGVGQGISGAVQGFMQHQSQQQQRARADAQFQSILEMLAGQQGLGMGGGPMTTVPQTAEQGAGIDPGPGPSFGVGPSGAGGNGGFDTSGLFNFLSAVGR